MYLQHVILHLIFLMSSSNEWGGVESSSYMYYVVELIRSSTEFMLAHVSVARIPISFVLHCRSILKGRNSSPAHVHALP